MKRTTCEECGGKIAAQNVEFKLLGESLGLFPAQVCQKCGEQLFDEATSDRIDLAAKKKGLTYTLPQTSGSPRRTIPS